MELSVIGCSGSMPGPASPASCYLVEHDGFRLLLDLGSGSVGALQRQVELPSLDAVALSHLHPDHCLDLVALYVARRYGPMGTGRPLPVFGPSDTADRLVRAYGLRDEPAIREEYAFGPIAQTSEVGPFRVSTARMSHPVETYAIRLDVDGQSLTYTGDTGMNERIVRLARGSDVLLAEAAFVHGEDNPPDLHLTGREAGDVARRAETGRLVVTHVPPWHDPMRARDEAADAFDGPVDVARSGEVAGR